MCQVAAYNIRLAGHFLFGGFKVTDYPAGFIKKFYAGFGKPQASCRPVEKTDPQPLFERGEGARNGGRRAVNNRGSLGEAAAIGHGDKNSQFLEAVHNEFHLME